MEIDMNSLKVVAAVEEQYLSTDILQAGVMERPVLPPNLMDQEMTREELESKATKFDELQRKLREAVNCPVCLTTPKEGPLHQE